MPGQGYYGLQRGQQSDNGEICLCLAKGLLVSLANNDITEGDFIANYYSYWLKSRPFDIGITNGKGLNPLFYKENNESCQGWATECREAAELNDDQVSSGGLLRAPILGVFCAQIKDEKLMERIIKAEQTMTHQNPLCLDATMSYCLAMKEIITNKGSIKTVEKRLASFMDRKETSSILKAFWKGEQGEKEVKNSEDVHWIMRPWFYTFQLIKEYKINFKDAMRYVLKQAGDTDTNCLIVGAMIGAILGFKRLYQENLEQFDIFYNCDVTIEHRRKRPQFFNPSNILGLTLEMIAKVRGFVEEQNEKQTKTNKKER